MYTSFEALLEYLRPEDDPKPHKLGRFAIKAVNGIVGGTMGVAIVNGYSEIKTGRPMLDYSLAPALILADGVITGWLGRN